MSIAATDRTDITSDIDNAWPARLARAKRRLPWAIFAGLAIWLFSLGFILAPVDTPSVDARLVLVVRDVPFERGDLVAYRYKGTPTWVYYRDYAMIHYVAGLPGDVVERRGDEVLVNGQAMGKLQSHSVHIHRLDPISPTVIPDGYLYVMSPNGRGFDSRYALHGLLPREAVIGRGIALF
jgi:conjugal transfer pilin signal peptidase TrbI